MNELMQFMEEFKELYHKGEQIMQKMQGGESYGQRRYRYGMRDSGGYSGGYGSGSYGQRWDGPQMHGEYPPMHGGYSNQQWPDVNPMMFM